MPGTPLPDRFEVLEVLARTESEEIVRARDRLLQREVQISRPSDSSSTPAGAQDLQRSLRQARALARVQHPGVVRLLDVIETPAGPLLVLDPVAGETLAERMARDGPLDPESVRDLGAKLCDALEAVHGVGVVHRGISAGNIVLRADGSPCLAGFTFAKFGATGEEMPGTTFVYSRRSEQGRAAPAIALPPIPAPEQTSGQTADARSDLFGLGWVLYECLTGEQPYPRELDVEHWKTPADPRRRAPSASSKLADAILRALRTSPLKRFASAAEMRAALVAAAPSVPGAAQSGASSGAGRRTKLVAAGAGAGVVLIAGFLALRGSTSSAANDVDPGFGAVVERGIARKSTPAPKAYSGVYTKSRALLIGIGEVYGTIGFQALPNAERDVDALANKLGQLEGEDWEIVTLKGAQAKGEAICSRVREMSRSAQKDDKLFVYYAGHGAKHPISERSGWIVPADAKSAAEDPEHVSWVRFDEFSRVFDESEAKHVLVAMDCCYGGRLTTWRGEESPATGSNRREVYGEALLTRGAQIVISSGRPFEAVSDGVSGENSPFARSFLEALSSPGGAPVTGHEIFSRITKTFIEEEVGHIPVLGSPPGSTPGGDIVFFPK